jgi:hypothetical protein
MTDVQVFSDLAAHQLNQFSSDHFKHQLCSKWMP